MSQFQNKLLGKIDTNMPIGKGKVEQVMLFALLDGFMKNCYPTDEEFVRDLRLFLEDE